MNTEEALSALSDVMDVARVLLRQASSIEDSLCYALTPGRFDGRLQLEEAAEDITDIRQKLEKIAQHGVNARLCLEMVRRCEEKEATPMTCTELTAKHIDALRQMQNGASVPQVERFTIIQDLLDMKMIGHAPGPTFKLLPDGESALEDLDEIDEMHRKAFPGGIAHPSHIGNIGKNWDGSEKK